MTLVMRMRWIAIVLALASPASAEEARVSTLGIDVTEVTVTGRGVTAAVVSKAMGVLDDVAERCYAAALSKAPKTTGTLAISFKLDAKGAASSVAVTGLASVNACVSGAIREASFDGSGKGPIEVREKVRLWMPQREAGILGTTAPEGSFASLTGTGDVSSGFDDPNIYGGLVGSGSAGFGRVGTGPGGGGLTGPYLTIGQPEAQGDLDKAIIRRYIKRNAQKLSYCYEKQLRATPALAGTVTAKFTITSAGTVTSATATGIHPDVATCVADVIKAIEFPRPKSGEVSVRYPLEFRADKKP